MKSFSAKWHFHPSRSYLAYMQVIKPVELDKLSFFWVIEWVS